MNSMEVETVAATCQHNNLAFFNYASLTVRPICIDLSDWTLVEEVVKRIQMDRRFSCKEGSRPSAADIPYQHEGHNTYRCW